MIDIGLNLVPAPDFSIEPEYFTFGSYTLGGVIRLTLNGTYYADTIDDYNSMVDSIVGLIGVCRTVYVSDCNSTTLSSIDSAVGYIENAEITAGDEVLNFEYSITIILTTDSKRKPLISANYKIDNVPANLIVNKYSRQQSVQMDNINTFAVVGVSDLSPVAGRLTVQSEIGLYNSDRCDSGSSTDLTEIVGNVLKAVGIDNQMIKKPSNYTDILTSENYKISQIGGSVTKEYVLVPATCKAIVNVNAKEQTDQITGQTKKTLSGSIVGVEDFGQAESVFNLLKDKDFEGIEKLLDNTCGPINPLPVDTCRVLSSSKRTDNSPKKTINFEFTYEEIEKCIAKGYQLSTEYTETAGVKKVAEYIIPGKTDPIVFISKGTSATKKKLRVSTKFTSCDEDFVDIVKSAVEAEFTRQKTELGLVGGNVIRLSKNENTGRYSYSKEEEYILCDEE